MACSSCDPLTHEQAFAELDGLPLVTALAGALDYIKEVRERCLAAGVPAMVAAPAPGRG